MSIPHSTFAQLSKSSINLRCSNRAVLDVYEGVKFASKKTDNVVLGMDSNPVPVTVRVRGSEHRLDRGIGQVTNSTQSLLDLATFQLELMFVADVLIAASTALSEVWTCRHDPMRGRRGDVDRLGF